ncbi:MAG: ABC transporter [Acidobacteria bacterium]|nr:MAG: ABC transporter [Acidobacteriota bacterium]
MINPRFISLTLYKAYADLRAESEKYYMSYLWWIVEPVLQMCVYYVVFGILFKRGTEGYVPFLLTGLIVWRWWAAVISEGSHALIKGKGLISQVYVPKYVFPMTTVLTQSFKFIIVFGILVVYLWLAGYSISLPYVILPFLLIVQIVLISGVTFCLAAVFPYLPDLRLLIDTTLRLMFFLSAIFYDASIVPPRFQTLFYLNPFVHLVEGYRAILLRGEWPGIYALSLILLFGMLLLFAGSYFMHLKDGKYAKVVF